MSKTTESRSLGPTPEDSVENGSGDDRLARIVQATLAIYLLPALALVLFVGFAMLFVGAVAQGFLRVARSFSSARRLAGRPEPLVSGAWIYRVGGGSRARRRTNQAQAVPQARRGGIRRPDSDVLN